MAKKLHIVLFLCCLAGPGSLLAAGCESPPEDPCAVREGEGSLDIECGPSATGDTGEWQQEAIDEAEEGFEKRSPRGRTP